jgi:hypothetical protein
MLDLRKPIAYFFLINAVILIAYGLYQPSQVLVGTQHINLNVVWGGVMAAFGLLMYAWSMFEGKAPHAPSHATMEEPEVPPTE